MNDNYFGNFQRYRRKKTQCAYIFKIRLNEFSVHHTRTYSVHTIFVILNGMQIKHFKTFTFLAVGHFVRIKKHNTPGYYIHAIHSNV